MYYRKKPVIIEAFMWTGDFLQKEDPEWIVEEVKNGMIFFGQNIHNKLVMKIITLEGIMEASVGDYIIKGVKGEIYPCKPDIFEATYELVGLTL